MKILRLDQIAKELKKVKRGRDEEEDVGRKKRKVVKGEGSGEVVVIVGRVKNEELEKKVTEAVHETCSELHTLKDAKGKRRNMMKAVFPSREAALAAQEAIKEQAPKVSVKIPPPPPTIHKVPIIILENITDADFTPVKDLIGTKTTITEFTPLNDSKSKAFRNAVRIQCQTHTEEVITLLKESKIGSIRVQKRMKEITPDAPKPQEPVTTDTYFIGNLPKLHETKQLFTDELRDVCGAKLSSFKLLKDELNLPNGCAIVTFARKRQAKAALRAIEEGKVVVSGRPVRIEEKQTAKELTSRMMVGDRHTVFVANLPLTLNEDQVRTVFTRFGLVASVSLNYGDEGFNGTARVTYEAMDAVTRALQHTGVLLVNRRPIRVDLDKRRAARSAQLDLNSTLSSAKSIMVSPVTKGAQLAVTEAKKIFAEVGKVKYCRRSQEDDTPDEEVPDGSVTLCFTSSACVAIALQMVGREVPTDAPPATTPVVVKVIGLETDTQVRPKEVAFTFNGARSWNTKEWVKKKRIETLESWNNKSSYGSSDTKWW